MANLNNTLPLGDEARIKLDQFVDTHADPMFDQLSECILTAANGGIGIRIVWHTNSSDEPLSLVSVDSDYATLIIYKTWQYDTELFTRLVADAGFPHLCKDITAVQNAVVFIGWGVTKEKSKS